MGRAKTHTRTADALPRSPFIILTPSQVQLDPATRKQVRSYVMRGKNRKSHSLRDNVALGSWINGRQGLEQSQQTTANQGIPRRVGNDMTHIPFAYDMKPYMQDLAFKCLSPAVTALLGPPGPVKIANAAAHRVHHPQKRNVPYRSMCPAQQRPVG